VNRRSLPNETFHRLRKQAEQLVKESKNQTPDIDQEDLVHLVEELEIYHIELELQNEELMRAKDELQASRDEFLDLYESSPVAYVTLDKEGIVERANEAAYRMLKGSGEFLLGSPFLLWVYKEDFSIYFSFMEKLASTKAAGPVVLRLLGKKGEIVHAHLEARPKLDQQTGLKHFRLGIVDITGLKQMEEEIRKARDEREFRVREHTAELEVEIEKRKKFEEGLKASTKKIIEEHEQRKYLARRLVDLLEKDRRDVAMMLHDEIGQILASIKMDLEGLETQLEGSPALERLTKAKDKTLEILRIIRNISSELRPTPLETLGLIPSVRSLVEKTEEYASFHVRFYTKGISDRLGSEKEIALYRIVQEALTNAAKHSGADEVFVNLIRRDAEIVLTVEDNGKGFDYDRVGKIPQSTDSPLGITIMRERATQFGGSFRIESQPGKGTQVMVEIPI
jgi:PAS domain S-box-containing protein